MYLEKHPFDDCQCHKEALISKIHKLLKEIIYFYNKALFADSFALSMCCGFSIFIQRKAPFSCKWHDRINKEPWGAYKLQMRHLLPALSNAYTWLLFCIFNIEMFSKFAYSVLVYYSNTQTTKKVTKHPSKSDFFAYRP